MERQARSPATEIALHESYRFISESDGFLYLNFDNPYDSQVLKSNKIPTITVTKDGHMVILYCTVGCPAVQAGINGSHPDARYSVYNSNGRGLDSSKLIRAGEGDMPVSANKNE